MPMYKVTGTKEGQDGPITISEHAHSLTKAEWVGAYYREHGYVVTISEVTPLDKQD